MLILMLVYLVAMVFFVLVVVQSCTVLFLQLILRVRDLLTTLFGSSTTLLLLLQLLTGQFAGRLDLLDVSESINLGLGFLLNNLGLCTLGVVVACHGQFSGLDRPSFGTDGISKVAVMG